MLGGFKPTVLAGVGGARRALMSRLFVRI